MYLKALKLHGFKSFADATTLNFEPGVTAVVGPNGCGKSNIADAIRWVLGEQSAKALRGGKMQDVIFEGTDTRRAAQFSEVSLLLTDCEKHLGAEFHEIEIMRRGHRDGLGEYFVNGQACRLKDIQRLFMDTGVGRASYSIMAQGQIDQILSSKPEERRAVFEEAAGITKYKSQRREAMNKLALTEQNLARVADVVAEVGRQIGSLRRQAAKALRYQRLQHRLRHLSLAWSGWQHEQLAAELARLDAAVAGLRAAATERRAKLDAGQADWDGRKAQRSRLNQRGQEAQQAVFDLRSQREAAESAARLAQTRREGLEERLVSARDGLGEIDMQRREVTAQSDAGTQDKQLQLNLLGVSDTVFQQSSREVALTEGALARIEQELHQAKFELLQFESTAARLQTDCSACEVEEKTSAHRHDALAQDLAQLREQQDTAARAAAERSGKVQHVQAEKTRADEASAAAQRALTALTREFREGQRQLQEIDRHLAQRGARLKLLQQLQERWEGFGEGAKAILQGRLAGALGGASALAVSQGIEVKPEFGAAVSALLGGAAEAIAVADAATAGRIFAQLEGEKIGSAILRIGDCGAARPAPGELPAGLIPAASAFERLPEDHPAAALLSACYVADDLAAFLEFWRGRPDFDFVAVATRKGEMADRRGLVSGGHPGARPPAAGIVQREIDVRETARALAEDQKRHDEQKARCDGLAARLAEAEQDLERIRGEQLAATQQVTAAQIEQREAQRAADEGAARLRRREQELAELAAARDEARARGERARAGLAEASASVAARREAIQRREAEAEAARADREAKREALAQARLELAERRQKVEVLDRGLGEMARRREQLDALLIQREQEIEVWTGQSADLERETGAQRARAAQLAETLGVAETRVEEAKRELAEAERGIDAAEAGLAALRAESDAAQGELSAQEVRLAEQRQRARFLAEDALREYQADVASVDWKALLWRADDDPEDRPASLDLDEEEAPAGEAAPAPRKIRRKPEMTEEDRAALDAADWSAVKTEVEALRQRLNGMGAVNLVAIAEYAELRQRHDFLKTQNDDLTRAKAELLGVIDEINRTSQQQFEVTFAQIQKNFAHTFQDLFGGGRAELELIQAEDILESGVEIVAQPPGTKLKSISLLSGGQKALTAVALLFALYLVKPSPFCLLDELDAPLDEVNIGRFTDLLKKFVPTSQFIIITHSKRTVAAAAAVYGVTMEERGVSKTVSMRFNHERGEAEAHTPNIAQAVAGTRAAATLSV